MRFIPGLLLCVLFMVPRIFLGQNYSIPLDQSLQKRHSFEFYSLDESKGILFPSNKPLLISEMSEGKSLDSIFDITPFKNPFSKKVPRYIWKAILNDHLLKINKDNFELILDPLVDFTLGKQVGYDQPLFLNSRGFDIKGSIGTKFSFESTFMESLGRFPEYVFGFIDETRVVPGSGLVRKFKDKDAYDFGFATGKIIWKPSKYFSLQAGHGKNFIGEGYRSLLLSDNSFNYPFLKLQTSVWRLKYVNLFSQFSDIGSKLSYSHGFQKKFGSFHYLNYAITKRIQVGFFEGIIWESGDSLGNRGFDLNYLNPVIFYRPVEFALGSPDNALMGLTAHYKASSNVVFYGQFILDDFKFAEAKKGNHFYQQKYGFQLGAHWFKPFKVEGLHAQAELNQVRPYTYAHKYTGQNYTHYNQPIAHPLGANFRELVGIVDYAHQRWFVDGKVVVAWVGEDSSGTHIGNNIFISDFEIPEFPKSYNHFLLQGVEARIINLNVQAGYVINPRQNLRLVASVSNRSKTIGGKVDNQPFFTLGLKTTIGNRYSDF